MKIEWVNPRSQAGIFLARYVIAFAAGAFSSLAHAPYLQIWALFVGFTIFTALFIYRQNQSKFSRVAEGQAFGFGFHIGGLHWIGNALMTDPDQFAVFYPLALVGLPFLLGFFYGLPLLFLRKQAKNNEIFFLIPILFVIGDYARGVIFTGFPWNLPAYSLAFSDIFMQIAYPLGIHFVNFLVITLACAPAGFLILKSGKEKITLGVSIFLVIAGSYFYGKNRIETAELVTISGEKFAVIQPDIEQKLKWLPEERNKNFLFLKKLTEQASAQAGEKTVTIWPETALQFHPEKDRQIAETLSELSAETGEIITGKMRFIPNPANPSEYLFYNSILQISDQGKKFQFIYDKIKLVPFGEYLPLSSLLMQIGFKQINHFQSAFTPGAGYQTFHTQGGITGAALICYEIIFPDFVRDFVKKEKPDLLINVTNDAWFGNSAGPHQHLTQARFRAIENGISVLRAANTGISAEIDPLGRIIHKIDFGKSGFFLAEPRKIKI